MSVVLVERGVDSDEGAAPDAPERVEVLRAATSGFLIRVDSRALVRAATTYDAVVWIDARIGDYLVRGVPMARVWRRSGDAVAEEDGAALHDAVIYALSTGFERTAGQDVAFGLRQITDVANKALSPGINDPTTAVHAIGHLAALLCDLGDRELGPRVVRDDHGEVRVVLNAPDFAELVEVTITQPRRYGAGDPQVLDALFRLLDTLACRVPLHLHPVVASHLDRLQTTVDAQDLDDTERALLALSGQRVRDRLV